MGSQDGEGDAGISSEAPGDPNKQDKLYEDRPGTKKIIRVFTVMAYMVSVSFVALTLSSYYIFLWQPPNPRLLHRASLQADPHIEYRVDDAPPSAFDLHERVNIFREQVLRNRGINISVRRNLSEEITTMRTVSSRNETNVTEISETSWNPMVRASLASRADTTVETSRADVYETVSKAPMNGNRSGLGISRLFTKIPEMNGQLSTNHSSSSSTPESKETPYKEPTSDSTQKPIALDANVDIRGSNDFTKHRLVEQTRAKGETAPARSYDSIKSMGKLTRGITIIGRDEKSKKYEDSIASYVTNGQRLSHGIQGNRTSMRLEGQTKERLIESTVQPNKLGSKITRVPVTRLAASDSPDLSEKFGTTVPAELASTSDIPADSSTEDAKSTGESSILDSLPLIVQPESPLLEEEGAAEERLTRDTSDFDFI